MGNCFGNDSGPDDNGRTVDAVSYNNNYIGTTTILLALCCKIESIDPFLFCYVKLSLQEERRRQAAEAAEKRQREAEGKGIKDPEAYKRKLEQREKMEREAERAGGGDAPLKVSHNNARRKTRLTAYNQPKLVSFLYACVFFILVECVMTD